MSSGRPTISNSNIDIQSHEIVILASLLDEMLKTDPSTGTVIHLQSWSMIPHPGHLEALPSLQKWRQLWQSLARRLIHLGMFDDSP
jgi:hypothetical protein